MTQQGKFILMNVTEFIKWLGELTLEREIQLIQNHHTFRPNYDDFAKINNHIYWLQSMEDYQVNHAGFSQIGQNITTFPDGKLAICRPFSIVPAGARGANHFGICIEHLGDFDKEDMTPQQQDTIVKVNATLCKRFNLIVGEHSIVYHHWYDLKTGERTNGLGEVKTCPGVKFFGGNTVDAAKENFYPLIQGAMESV